MCSPQEFQLSYLIKCQGLTCINGTYRGRYEMKNVNERCDWALIKNIKYIDTVLLYLYTKKKKVSQKTYSNFTNIL